jgi:hypothetical protein
MLYLGWFDAEKAGERKDRLVEFTLVVEAADPEAACQKFKQLLYKLRDDGSGVLSDVTLVYIKCFMEIRSVPADGFLARYEEFDPDPVTRGSISICGIGATEDHMSVFDWAESDPEQGPQAAVPFVTFSDKPKLLRK